MDFEADDCFVWAGRVRRDGTDRAGTQTVIVLRDPEGSRSDPILSNARYYQANIDRLRGRIASRVGGCDVEEVVAE